MLVCPGGDDGFTSKTMCLVKPADTVGEPISTLPSQPLCVDISTVLYLQRSHRQGAVFDPAEFANSIPRFCETTDEMCNTSWFF
jgi:hypothetical protein